MSLRRKLLSPMINNRSFLSSSKSLNEFRVPECDFDNDATILKITGGGNDDSRRIDTTEVLNAEEEKAWSWSNILPEILGEIVRRVEASSQNWPERRNVVACGCVCRQWREVTKEVVKFPCGSINNITFPSCLKKPGAYDYPIQCLIKHDKKNAMFYLYLALSSSSTEKGKFLLVARRSRNGANSEYIISLDADDFSQGSNAYVGKLRSDIIASNFTIYDSQPPYPGAKSSSCRARRRFASKRISPQVHAGNYAIGEISYKFNFLRSRSPRRMVCAVRCPSSDESAINVALDDLNLKGLQSGGYTVLKNRLPKWHEHFQCWCLNFHGRVTIASVKNFQLVATMDQSQPGGKDEDDTVVLQFGKVGDGIFTMDFIQPLSAFQAFAICLTSFGTKLACD